MIHLAFEKWLPNLCNRNRDNARDSFSSQSSKAQWTTGSSIVYTTNSSDKVGMGTSNPFTKLHVAGGDISWTRIKAFARLVTIGLSARQ